MVVACIVTYDEYFNIPYVKDYENLLINNQIQYDFLLWNRTGDKMEMPVESRINHVFNYITKKSKISKVIPFLMWRRFAKRILKKNKYDFLIVCTTIPAVLLTDLLLKSYKDKFLLDIRDYTYENIRLYRYALKKLINYSGLTVISSKGFLEWLPFDKDAYVVSHNLTNFETVLDNVI